LFHRQKKKGAFTPQNQPRGTNGLSKVILNLRHDQERYNQSKEQNAQYDSSPKQCAFNAATGSKHASSVGTCQSTQTSALALKDHAQDEQDRDYNQRDIQIRYHVRRASF
jgi:hypothetical protein